MEVTDFIKEALLNKYPPIKHNADDISFITWDGITKELRFITEDGKLVLQQLHTFCIHYRCPVSHGSFDTYTKDYGNLWLDVPLVEDSDP
jgi:hypothetical protein